MTERVPGNSDNVIEAGPAHGNSAPLGSACDRDRDRYMELRRKTVVVWADYLDKFRHGADLIPIRGTKSKRRTTVAAGAPEQIVRVRAPVRVRRLSEVGSRSRSDRRSVASTRVRRQLTTIIPSGSHNGVGHTGAASQ